MSNKHQLIPNTYTICKSTEQCKELFELANSKGIVNFDMPYYKGETHIAFMDSVVHTNKFGILFENGGVLIPLDEFISRLQGKWEQPNELSVKLPNNDWEIVYKCLIAIIEEPENWKGVKDEERILESIKEQLNQQL